MRHRFLTGIALAGLLCTSTIAPADAVAPVSSIPPVATTGTHLSVTIAASVKPRANLAAERQDLPSGKVLVSVTSNAKKVKLTYRTAKNTKRTTNIKIRKGMGKATLAKGSMKIYAQAAATSKLRRSLKIPVLPPVPTQAPATSAPPVAAPAPTAPVATPTPVTPVPVNPPPGPVIGLTATARSPWSIQLSWTNPADPDLEWVEIRSDGDSWGTDVEETTYTDRYLQPGTTHTYTLRTYDTAENAGPPVTVSATTWAQAPVVGPAATVVRISTDSAASQANEGSYGAVWSPDSTMVAFESWASNLVPDDTNECSDVFVKNLSSGVLLRISTSASGGEANGCAFRPAWAPDGSRLAFESWASNLVADDTNRSNDVFIKTLQSGAVQRVSTTGIGGQTNNDSYGPAWSPDGSQIAFQSYADNLVAEDTNDDSDIFVKTLQGGAIQRISTTAAGGQSNGGASAPAWSPDGTQMAFESWASNLLPGDTNDAGDIFVKTLNSGAVQRISTGAGGVQGNGGAYRPVWSPTGTRIAFESWSTNLVADDINDSTDVFVSTLASGAIERVSTTAGGGQADYGGGGPVWSPDGTRIAFESWSTNLVADDINDSTDVFVKTLATGAIQLVSTDPAGRLVDSGAGGPAFSPDGAKIAFGSSSSGLVLGDTNGVDDLFVKTLP